MVTCGSNLRSERVSGEITHRVTILRVPGKRSGTKGRFQTHTGFRVRIMAVCEGCRRFAVVGWLMS